MILIAVASSGAVVRRIESGFVLRRDTFVPVLPEQGIISAPLTGARTGD